MSMRIRRKNEKREGREEACCAVWEGPQHMIMYVRRCASKVVTEAFSAKALNAR